MSINRKQRRKQKRQARPAAATVAAISRYPEVVRSLSMIQQLREKGSAGPAADLARQVLAIEPGNHHIHLALGGALQDGRKFDDAIACYLHCIKLAPQDATGHAQLARCLIETGDFPGAVASCERALKLAPDALGLHQMAGKAYERMARFGDAAGHYKAVADRTGYHA
ncbi:MAG: tetratricopeptide repeat protein, partial [Rhizobiales bacterium]|nr:tetratricopeptide repeat protein [Hyphomicrobiales bacterium]